MIIDRLSERHPIYIRADGALESGALAGDGLEQPAVVGGCCSLNASLLRRSGPRRTTVL
jgi:hypothetical protein